MKAINLNELKDRAYRIACEHGFHDEEYSNEHFLALTITELSEAIEADRNNKRANIEQFEVDKNLATELLVSDDSYFVTSYQKNIKGTIEEELADVFIRLLDLFGTLSLDESIFSRENIQGYSEVYQDRSFTECIFDIEELLIKNKRIITTLHSLPEIFLLRILGLAKHLGIDLFYHIDLKMRYNELRPKKHGKKY